MIHEASTTADDLMNSGPVSNAPVLRLLAVLLPALFVGLHAAQPSAPKPNILFLLADDLGYADIGVNGCTDFATPNIDSIARNGVRFTSGYVSAPVCSPTRAGLMSGRAGLGATGWGADDTRGFSCMRRAEGGPNSPRS